jgi:hypothetical protein
LLGQIFDGIVHGRLIEFRIGTHLGGCGGHIIGSGGNRYEGYNDGKKRF